MKTPPFRKPLFSKFTIAKLAIRIIGPLRILALILGACIGFLLGMHATKKQYGIPE